MTFWLQQNLITKSIFVPMRLLFSRIPSSYLIKKIVINTQQLLKIMTTPYMSRGARYDHVPLLPYSLHIQIE